MIHFVKANGSTSTKVFKLNSRVLEVGECLELDWVHKIREITIRKYYAWVHRVEVQVNGKVLGGRNFELQMYFVIFVLHWVILIAS